MPELPEVYTIVADLQKNIVGYTITGAIVAKGYTAYPDTQSFIESVTGCKVTSIERVAKNIIIKMDSPKDVHIHIHLAMTGRVLLRDSKEIKDSWTKAAFKLIKNGAAKYLKFCDMRTFGKIGLISEGELEILKNKYGPEPLAADITAEKFMAALRLKRTSIKNALMDQAAVSGLGNIYATEALFLAGVHPLTQTNEITLSMAEKLLEAAKNVLTEGVLRRGSTLPDKMYVDIFGREGHYQDHFKIYLKNICGKCGSRVQQLTIAGRNTYFCPKCQPEINRKLL